MGSFPVKCAFNLPIRVIVVSIFLSISFETFSSEWIVVAHGVSTGRYIAPKLREKAARLGMSVKIAHLQVGNFPALLASSYNGSDFDQEFKFENQDLDKVVAALRKLNLQYPIVTGAEDIVPTVDYLNEVLKLPGNGTVLSEVRRDKEKLYQLLADKGLSAAPFIGASSFKEAMAKLRKARFAFPIIVKPVDDAGGRGFRKVLDERQLKESLKELLDASTTTMFAKKVSRIVMQPFLVGPEFAVQGAVLGGEAIFTDVIDYIKRGAVYEVDKLAEPNLAYTRERIAIAEKVLRATKIANQAFHIEIIKDDKYGYVPNDVASRAMGGVDHLMVAECTGYNQLDALVDSILAPNDFRRISRERKIRGIPYNKFKSGMVLDLIQHFSGVAIADPDITFVKSLTTYVGHKISIEKGDRVAATTDLLNSPGAVWLAGNDEQLEADRSSLRAFEAEGRLIPVRPYGMCSKVWDAASRTLNLVRTFFSK